MRNLLSGGLVVFAGVIASSPLGTSVVQRAEQSAAVYWDDPRFKALRSFLVRHGCPAATVAHVFLEAADDYDLDWRLLPSISFIESTGGKQARRNNLFGWDNGRASFPSMSASIHTVGYRLANSRRYKDKELDELLYTYNPRPDYVETVKTVMRRIAPTE